MRRRRTASRHNLVVLHLGEKIEGGGGGTYDLESVFVGRNAVSENTAADEIFASGKDELKFATRASEGMNILDRPQRFEDLPQQPGGELQDRCDWCHAGQPKLRRPGEECENLSGAWQAFEGMEVLKKLGLR